MNRLILLVCLFCCQSLFAQDSSKLHLTHLAMDIGGEILFHGNQTNNHFYNIVNDKSILIHEDSSLTYNGHSGTYDFLTSGINIGFKRDNSKFRFVVGLSIDGRTDRRYYYSGQEEFRVDTIVQSTGSSSDTLFRDSVVNTTLTYSLQSRHLFARYEALYDLGRGNFRFSTGLGFMLGYSMGNTANARYSNRYENRIMDSNNQFLYTIDHGSYYNSGTFFGPQMASIGQYSSKVYRRIILKPYLPLYLEFTLGNNKVFSHMAVAYNGRVGAEFQITLHDGVNPRFFHAHNLVLMYKI